MEKVFVSSLDLKEFRGIREFKEPLELAKFNVLVGRNNSGKSAILHALSLLPHPSLDLPMSLRVGPWERRIGVFEYLLGGRKSAIYRYAGSASLEFKVKAKIRKAKPGVYTADLPPLDEIKEKACHVEISEGGIRFSVEEKEVNANTCCERLGIEGERAKDFVAFVPNDSTFLRDLGQKLRIKWPSIEKSGAHVRVVKEIINESVNETFTEIIVREDELYARKEVNGIPFYVKVRDLGDGVKKILSVLLWLEACSPELVLWDDFEASVHPTLIKLVLEWLVKKDWQVVITTHSIDTLLKLLEIDTENKDSSIILLQKTPGDILLHKRHTLEELEDFVMANQDPRLLPDLLKV
ncbi:MAG: ATP-binding protein [Candidatus Methanospirareceae archaeon]